MEWLYAPLQSVNDILFVATDNLEWWQVVLVLADYSLKIAALGWVPADRRPSSAMAWLLAIFLVPFVGIALFFLMGSPYVNRRRHRIQNRANEQLRELGQDEPDIPDGTELTDELLSLVHLNRELTSLPALDGSLLALHPNYEQSIAAMTRAVDEAKIYVNVEIYIMAWDSTTAPFFEALGRAVDRGVPVRLLYDHVGSMKYPGHRKLGKRFTNLGIRWHLMLPLQPLRWRFRRPDLRNHRKLLVVDGRKAFVGSQNMIDSSYLKKSNLKAGRHWVDVMAEVTGPIVNTINSVFAVDWYTESNEELGLLAPTKFKQQLSDNAQDTGREIMQVIPSGPGFTTEPNLRLFTSIAHHSKQKLQLISPYFIPDESLLEAITTACYRGVTVELYVSEKADQFLVGRAQASYYRELLKAGVEIYLYPAPAVLHAKFMIADAEVAVMGSSNMDMRSFGLNYEISLMTGEGELMEQLKELAESYREKCKKLTLEQWRERPWYSRYVDNVARLTSSLQ